MSEFVRVEQPFGRLGISTAFRVVRVGEGEASSAPPAAPVDYPAPAPRWLGLARRLLARHRVRIVEIPPAARATAVAGAEELLS